MQNVKAGDLVKHKTFNVLGVSFKMSSSTEDVGLVLFVHDDRVKVLWPPPTGTAEHSRDTLEIYKRC